MLRHQPVACLQNRLAGCSEQADSYVAWLCYKHSGRITIFLEQLVEIQPLMTAGGVRFLCCSSKEDLTTVPTLEDLLDAREGYSLS